MEEKKSILAYINSPDDVKKLDNKELSPLCDEIRKTLIETLSKQGGHLASNLGTVELSVALHRVFSTPGDQIVWDVGHQSYTHKLLTGRKEKFYTIRKKGGISGFPNPKESVHDAFLTGHSSTSLAAAFGLARAKAISGDDGHVIAVVGDGAASGGMFYEGLNNIGHYHDRLIVILNDNKISISKNIGGVAKYLSEIRVRPKYFKAKDSIERYISKIPLIGKWLRRKISSSKSMLKYALFHNTWFEEFGFTYLGPVDGHDVKTLCEVLKRAKSLNRPVFIHIETVKGKGYKFAEENPGAYHGVKPFDPEIGNKVNKTSDGFSEAFGKLLAELGREDKKICAISPAMKYATGLDKFAAEFPRRFLDVGIAEPLAITTAAGMAKNGIIPVVAVYSSFLQRAYDQVLHDAAISNLHIVIAIDRAGIVGEDGETHQGIFDVAFLSTIPDVTIFSPSNLEELSLCLKRAIYDVSGVVAIRYPKGTSALLPERFELSDSEQTLYCSDLNNDKNRLIITYGRVYEQCAKSVELAEKNGVGVDILKLVNLSCNPDSIELVSKYKNVLFVEEGTERGSISEKFGNELLKSGFSGKYRAHTLGNSFIAHQSVSEAFKEYKMDAESIYNMIKE
ncbi:MAG: 1-deoxy-D-xylulose-5-phosphate synthase [Oscillospiraceae bacterium]|nr:1-deoxy-D-xylulose-5-phosphate synthase [Oscillospiraceae bacterium]